MILATLKSFMETFIHYDWTLKSVATDLAFVAGILTAAGIIFAKLVKPILRHARTVNQLLKTANKILAREDSIDFSKLAKDVEIIIHDLRPNSGSSLRDAVDRIEDRIVLMDRVQWAIRQDGPVGIFICDKTGRNSEVNRTYCRWLGVGSDELLGHGWRALLAGPSQREDYDDEWSEAFSQGREVEFRIDLRAATGEVKIFDIHAYPLHTRSGDVGDYLGVIRLAGE